MSFNKGMSKMSSMTTRRRSVFEDMILNEDADTMRDIRHKLRIPNYDENEVLRALDDIIKTAKEERKKLMTN